MSFFNSSPNKYKIRNRKKFEVEKNKFDQLLNYSIKSLNKELQKLKSQNLYNTRSSTNNFNHVPFTYSFPHAESSTSNFFRRSNNVHSQPPLNAYQNFLLKEKDPFLKKTVLTDDEEIRELQNVELGKKLDYLEERDIIKNKLEDLQESKFNKYLNEDFYEENFSNVKNVSLKDDLKQSSDVNSLLMKIRNKTFEEIYQPKYQEKVDEEDVPNKFESSSSEERNIFEELNRSFAELNKPSVINISSDDSGEQILENPQDETTQEEEDSIDRHGINFQQQKLYEEALDQEIITKLKDDGKRYNKFLTRHNKDKMIPKLTNMIIDYISEESEISESPRNLKAQIETFLSFMVEDEEILNTNLFINIDDNDHENFGCIFSLDDGDIKRVSVYSIFHMFLNVSKEYYEIILPTEFNPNDDFTSEDFFMFKYIVNNYYNKHVRYENLKIYFRDESKLSDEAKLKFSNELDPIETTLNMVKRLDEMYYKQQLNVTNKTEQIIYERLSMIYDVLEPLLLNLNQKLFESFTYRCFFDFDAILHNDVRRSYVEILKSNISSNLILRHVKSVNISEDESVFGGNSLKDFYEDFIEKCKSYFSTVTSYSELENEDKMKIHDILAIILCTKYTIPPYDLNCPEKLKQFIQKNMKIYENVCSNLKEYVFCGKLRLFFIRFFFHVFISTFYIVCVDKQTGNPKFNLDEDFDVGYFKLAFLLVNDFYQNISNINLLMSKGGDNNDEVLQTMMMFVLNIKKALENIISVIASLDMKAIEEVKVDEEVLTDYKTINLLRGNLSHADVITSEDLTFGGDDLSKNDEDLKFVDRSFPDSRKINTSQMKKFVENDDINLNQVYTLYYDTRVQSNLSKTKEAVENSNVDKSLKENEALEDDASTVFDLVDKSVGLSFPTSDKDDVKFAEQLLENQVKEVEKEEEIRELLIKNNDVINEDLRKEKEIRENSNVVSAAEVIEQIKTPFIRKRLLEYYKKERVNDEKICDDMAAAGNLEEACALKSTEYKEVNPIYGDLDIFGNIEDETEKLTKESSGIIMNSSFTNEAIEKGVDEIKNDFVEKLQLDPNIPNPMSDMDKAYGQKLNDVNSNLKSANLRDVLDSSSHVDFRMGSPPPITISENSSSSSSEQSNPTFIASNTPSLSFTSMGSDRSNNIINETSNLTPPEHQNVVESLESIEKKIDSLSRENELLSLSRSEQSRQNVEDNSAELDVLLKLRQKNERIFDIINQIEEIKEDNVSIKDSKYMIDNCDYDKLLSYTEKILDNYALLPKPKNKKRRKRRKCISFEEYHRLRRGAGKKHKKIKTR